jgi:hypothetical protein
MYTPTTVPSSRISLGIVAGAKQLIESVTSVYLLQCSALAPEATPSAVRQPTKIVLDCKEFVTIVLTGTLYLSVFVT